METLTAGASLAFEAEADGTHRRIAAAIALSLLVHALVLNVQRSESRRDVAEPPRPIAVRLRPPPPAPRVEETPAPPTTRAPRPARPTQQRRPRAVIAVDPARAPTQPDPFSVQQAPEPVAEPDTPRFDPEAARKMARSLANMRDPAKEGTAVGQFPDKPLETETRAARAIGAAKRRDCKDGLPGGLMGPLLILADKKDSGCKW